MGAIGFFVDRAMGFFVDGRSNLRAMCDRIRFVSPLVCPRREGQLVRPRVRRGFQPLTDTATNPSEYCTNTQIPDFFKKSVI